VMNALSPAKVQRVTIINDQERVMEVVVEDKQLSLAIGKKGQNVRLAAKLTGWRIDIKSEEEKRKEVEAQLGAFEVSADEEDGASPVETGRDEPGTGDATVQTGDEERTVHTMDDGTVQTTDDGAVQTTDDGAVATADDAVRAADDGESR
jgi:predicted PilT family ATPase